MRRLTARVIAPDTWVVEGAGCYCYLLDAERPLVIDSGLFGGSGLRRFASDVLGKPVDTVVNTHGHLDHIAGNASFETALMTTQAAEDASRRPALFLPTPKPGRLNLIQDGDVLDRGGRALEVLHIGAHSPGSAALLDRKHRLLFTGDELEAGQVLLIPLLRYDVWSQTVQRHLGHMERLSALRGQFDLICPAHNGTPLTCSVLDSMITLEKRILAGEEGRRDIRGPSWPFRGGRFARRATLGGVSLCYDIRRIIDGGETAGTLGGGHS